MKLSWLIILLLPSVCLADGLPAIPSPNDIPMFWGMTGNDPAYHEAAFKAQQAFLIQIGFMAQYNMVTGFISSEVTKVAQTAQNKVAAVIDEDTPLDSKQVFFAIAMGYTVAVKKELTQKFRNPLFRSVRHTATVGQDHGSIGVEIPF